MNSTATAPKAPPVAAVKVVNGLVNSRERVQNRLLPPPAVLLNMTAGSLLITRAIYIAAELGIADRLARGPRTVDDLAAEAEVEPDALYRVLRALASIGIFAESIDRTFQLTPLGEYLRSDTPGSMRGWARYVGADWHWNLWGALPESVRNGKSTYENIYGMRFFEWFADNPEPDAIFNEAMTSVSEMANPAILAAYDFGGVSSLVDVAGGHGSLLAAILRKYPQLHGVLFEQPHVIETALHGDVRGEDLASRMDLASGDFFVSVPEGHDAYLLKWILHDWSDDEATRILKAVRRAMRPGARVLVAEMVITPDNAPSFGKLLDLAMLALTGGRERTTAEYAQLFDAAGFTLKRVIPTASPYSIVEGVAV